MKKREKMTILLIDDEAPILMLIKEQLDRTGLEILIAESVADARIYFNNPDLQLVVTDLSMPKEDGHTVIRWFLEHRPEIPILVFSSNASTRNKILTVLAEAETEQAGVTYVEKPNWGALIQAIAAKLP
jgi:DNA-binding response OmpR family regulator